MAHLGTRSLLFAVRPLGGDGSGGEEYVDYTDTVSNVVLGSVARADDRRLLFEPDYAHGGMRDHQLALTYAQNTSPASLWTLAYNARPPALVSFYLAPYGNPIATDDQPHHEGQAFLVAPAGNLLGGAAAPARRGVQTVDAIWPLCPASKPPELITSGTYPAALPEGW